VDPAHRSRDAHSRAAPEPHPGRKFAATGVLSALAIVLAVAVAALANVLGSALMDGHGAWGYGLGGLRDTVLFQALSLLQDLHSARCS
jgi:hypothetical protein